jgi:Flp pilus assembly protein TadD
MRSVDSMGRVAARAAGAVAALVAAGAMMTGCGTVAEPLKAMQQAVANSFSAAPGASNGAAAAAKPAASPTTDAPLSPAVQSAFDNAVRAMKAGRTDEAERGFRALAQSNPQLGGPHANLGVILRQANKLPEAVTELELAVKLSPRQPVYFNQLGITYRQAGQFAKARDAYETAIALDANYAAPCLNLGILSDLYLGEAKRALELYDRYLALSPSGDAAVSKWVADLKNRKPAPITLSRKEKA